MNRIHLKLILVSTPVGHLGSGKGGGVEITFLSLLKGLLDLGHEITVIAPMGSELPSGCDKAKLINVEGAYQPSWQHQDCFSSISIPHDGVLPKMWNLVMELSESCDAILNFSYDWLPIWITPYVNCELFHLVSMGAVAEAMKDLINDLGRKYPFKFAFHSYSQAADYELISNPIIVGNGFDLNQYQLNLSPEGCLGWAGRISPEKGLEDAVAVAAALGHKLLVWGVIENPKYASEVEASVSSETIEWRGFLSTDKFQRELGKCRAFLNTPKWNEAYGNVVVEAMACGVPVVAYQRGGPGELIVSGVNGWVVDPDDTFAMKNAILRIGQIDRKKCREWAENFASQKSFALRVENWISDGIEIGKFSSRKAN